MKAYIDITTRLPRPPPRTALVIAFSGDQVLLATHDTTHDLPESTFEPAEALHKTIRRETYYTTGAFLTASALLGTLWVNTTPTAIYVGTIGRIERPVLKNGGAHLVPAASLDQYLTEPHWQKTLHYLIRHAWHLKSTLQKDHP